MNHVVSSTGRPPIRRKVLIGGATMRKSIVYHARVPLANALMLLFLTGVILLSAPGVGRGACTTTGYAGSVTYEWPLPEGYTTAYAMRFSPGDTLQVDSLRAVKFFVYNPADGSFGNDIIYVKVYSDNGGLPGTMLASVPVSPGSYVAYPETTTVDLSALGLVFDSDFHIGISTSATVDHETILSDDGTTGTARSSYFYQGQWYPFPRGGNQDYDFHVFVTLCMPYVAICGSKFDDRNCNGVQDMDEPGLSGWVMNIYGGSPLQWLQSATTDNAGSYCFYFAGYTCPAGPLYVSEVQQSRWVQTAPMTCKNKVTPAGYGTYYVPPFGNTYDTCQNSLINLSYVGGVNDTFSSANGPEPANPTQGLLDALQDCHDGPNSFFDDQTSNTCFGHSFTGDWCSSGCCVLGATLTFRLKAHPGSGSVNDAVYLGKYPSPGPVATWIIPCSTLVRIATNGADKSWDQYDEMEVTLDLGNLPPDAYGVTSVMPLFHAGGVDVIIEDDTQVDYLKLTVTVCCENGISGQKFDDRDCDGIWDSGEPSISGWTFRLYDATPALVQTTTTGPNGAFWFGGLNAGTYYVSEVGQPGWIQTAPASCRSTVVLAPNSSGLAGDFGNYDSSRCKSPMYWQDERTYLAGVIDNFSILNGTERAWPSHALQAALDVCTNDSLVFFDSAADQQCFGHSFTGCCNDTCCVIGAKLCTRLRASGETQNTDKLYLGNWQAGVPSVWAITLTDLLRLITGDADTIWNVHNGSPDTMTVCLDLGNLPVSSTGVTSVMPLFRTGGLDVLIQDDTEVDYLKLDLTLCCKNFPSFVPGDANGDKTVDISDAVYLISYIFAGGPAPDPLEAGDANCDGSVDISDAVYLIAYIFTGGPAPCEGSLGKLSPQSATLTLATTEESTESGMASAVAMQSEAEVAGVQLEFNIEGGKASDIVAQTAERSANLQVFSGMVDGLFKVGLIDMTGRNAIAAGDGPIVTFEFKGDKKELDLVNAIICDRQAQKLSVRIERSEKTTALPKQFSLSQNYPNPFNPSTAICFALPKPSEVRLDIYNILGQNVRTLVSGMQPAGRHAVEWDGADCRHHPVPSGVYLYRLSSSDFTDTKKMLLLK